MPSGPADPIATDRLAPSPSAPEALFFERIQFPQTHGANVKLSVVVLRCNRAFGHESDV
jgi:hypothetical protein